jgi:hypothetical protein
MILDVPDHPRALTSENLAALLERLPVERAGAKAGSEVTDAQMQRLLGRIAALTDALRETHGGNGERIAARILLDDLATVVGQFRGRANTARAALAGAEQGLRDALAGFKVSGGPAAPTNLGGSTASE